MSQTPLKSAADRFPSLVAGTAAHLPATETALATGQVYNRIPIKQLFHLPNRPSNMPLNEEATEITWPATHFVHVRKMGPFAETASAAWQELHRSLPAVTEAVGQPHAFFSLYQVHPENIYMAGVGVTGEASAPPAGLEYIHFEGGKYLQFTLTGPYDQLPTACGRVFALVKERGIAVDESRLFIENYVNNPGTVPPEELITHICIPIV